MHVAGAADQPGAVTLSFDSPVLHRRITNTVFVPDSWRRSAQPLPVLYYLHGTIITAVQSLPVRPVLDHAEPLMSQIARGGGKLQTDAFHFAQLRDKANYLVVAPDTDPRETVFTNSFWVDGRLGHGLPAPGIAAEPVLAETFLNKELQPLVESLFHTRTDRQGRGIMGFSAGGEGALIQALRHPDRYAQTLAISPNGDILDDPKMLASFVLPIGFLLDQGYGTPVTDEIGYRNFNPPELAANAAKTGMDVIVSAGDSCLPPDAQRSPNCTQYPALANPFAASVEALVRLDNDAATKRYAQAGLDVEYLRVHGVHGAANLPVYSSMIDRINATFAKPEHVPATFSYRTADSSFSPWGYRIVVTRPNTEFATLSGQTDGRAFDLAGTGHARVDTPPVSGPNTTIDVQITRQDGVVESRRSTTDDTGRLHLDLDLAPPRVLDERRLPAGIDGPLFPQPVTHVAVHPVP